MPKLKVLVLPIAARKPENERNNPVNATKDGWVRTPLNHDQPEMLTESRGLIDLLAKCNLKPDGVTKIDSSKPIGIEVVMDVYDPNSIPVKSVEVLPPSGDIKVGDTVSFDYDVMPADASYPDVEWSSADETILQTLGDGQFKALKVGAYVVKATAIDGGVSDTHSGNVVAAAVTP
ncbi:structural protein with Ig domain [Erwinia phage vB_EamM-Bue1]|uniref:Putative tail protein n=1 Tax=Erwinia phage vB_EamM-Bue1 TaxID=2099338 RepID=A0A2P1JU16_9CAUD|nr:structural protein with Ig domain [Erwinia phage vB_EamM-Bue1]AVO22848.1 putative tail protein [Erwinia phage vB_EamM-Bue1]